MKPTLFSMRALVMAVLLVTALAARADDVYVVANAALQLSPEEVKEIFLGEVQFTGSTKLLPVDNAGAQADFLARVLKMSGPKYQAAWTKKAFRDGLNAPPLKASDAEVIAFVKGNRGAIGYVNSVPAGVNVIGRY